MKKTVILSFLTLCLAWGTTVQAQSWEGSGLEEDPFLITSVEQLAELATRVNDNTDNNNGYNGVYFRLTADLDLSAYSTGAGWAPIGGNFCGNFKGGGHIVRNLYINRSSTNQGLFGVVVGGSIDSLGIVNADITGSVTVGILAGAATGGTVITNCYVTGKIIGEYYLGALVGQLNGGSVVTSFAAATVHTVFDGDYTDINIGGLIGSINGGSVSNSYITGNQSSVASAENAARFGGFSGGITGNGTIRNCYSAMSLSSSYRYTGGLVGRNVSSSGYISNSVAANSSVSNSYTKTSETHRLVAPYSSYANRQLRGNHANADMLLNGVTVTNPATNPAIDYSVEGFDTPLATLKTAAFYTTSTNWSALAGNTTNAIPDTWDLQATANKNKIWNIWDGNSLPYFQYQSAPAVISTATVTTATGIYRTNDGATTDSIAVYVNGAYSGRATLSNGAWTYTYPAPVADGSAVLVFVYERSKAISYGVEAIAGTTYKLSAVTADPVGGSVTISPRKDWYLPSETVTLTATAKAGYEFDGWETVGGGSSRDSENPKIITTTQDLSLIAHFARIYTLAATANIPTAGSISKDPQKASYRLSEVVTLTATPGVGYNFVEWKAGEVQIATTPVLPLTMVCDTVLTAVFAIQPDFYTLTATASPASYGSVSRAPEQSSYYTGSSVTLTATPAAGYQFSSWSSGDITLGSEAELTLSVTQDSTLSANFIPLPYTVTASVLPTPAVTVPIAPAQPYFDSGDVVTLTAPVRAGFEFASWSSKGTTLGTDETLTFTVTQDTVIVANYTRLYTVRIVPNDANGSITLDPVKPYYHTGEEIAVTVTPAPGYAYFPSNGMEREDHQEPEYYIDTTETFTLTVGTYDYSYGITFYSIDVITTSAEPTEGGSVTVNYYQPFYTYNSTLIYQAVANPGYEFDYWSIDDAATSNPAQFRFQVPDKVHTTDLVAHFVLTSGIEAVIAPASALSVYPNPVSDVLYLQSAQAVTGATLSHLSGVEVLSVSGNAIPSLNLAALPAGFYLAKFTLSDGSVVVKKIKKQ